MYQPKKNCDYCNDEDIEDVFSLLEKNVDCTHTLINRIDDLIEHKYLSESIIKILTTLRNTCAMNVMNIAQLTK